MGFWDALRGQTRPKQARLDALFAVPSAAMSLEAGLGLRPTGSGSVCFRAAEGGAAALTQAEAAALVSVDGGPTTSTRLDEYGFTWLTVHAGTADTAGLPELGAGDPPSADTSGLVTSLHAVNSALEAQGFGPGLLCSTIGFVDGGGHRSYVVYLYKQGTFYPFCPTGPTSRDELRERVVRDTVGGDLPIEPDTSRWMPLWGLSD
ncbi:MAG: hypothetical protein JWR42_2282 [Marmoricola sp.]|nr:hypothetical protein [Marmoricola sp.]